MSRQIDPNTTVLGMFILRWSNNVHGTNKLNPPICFACLDRLNWWVHYNVHKFELDYISPGFSCLFVCVCLRVFVHDCWFLCFLPSPSSVCFGYNHFLNLSLPLTHISYFSLSLLAFPSLFLSADYSSRFEVTALSFHFSVSVWLWCTNTLLSVTVIPGSLCLNSPSLPVQEW